MKELTVQDVLSPAADQSKDKAAKTDKRAQRKSSSASTRQLEPRRAFDDPYDGDDEGDEESLADLVAGIFKSGMGIAPDLKVDDRDLPLFPISSSSA